MSLLQRMGCAVAFPEQQTCCGQVFTNTGYFAAGLTTVRTYVDAFEPYDYIVAPSASCIGSVRYQHEMLCADDPALAARVTALVPKSYDLTEFLIDVLGVTDVGASFPHTVTYHPTCHSVRVCQVGDRPLRLLEKVQGLRLIDLPDSETCCGFGGTFAVKNPDVSAAMGTDKVRNAESTGAEVLCAADNSCLMHIGGTMTRMRVGMRPVHIAEILASTEEEHLR